MLPSLWPLHHEHLYLADHAADAESLCFVDRFGIFRCARHCCLLRWGADVADSPSEAAWGDWRGGRVLESQRRISHWVQDSEWTDCVAAQPCLLWDGGLQGERPVYYNWQLLREGNTNRLGVALKANTTTRPIDSPRIYAPGWKTLHCALAQEIRADLLRPLRVAEFKWSTERSENPSGAVETPTLQLLQQSLSLC